MSDCHLRKVEKAGLTRLISLEGQFLVSSLVNEIESRRVKSPAFFIIKSAEKHHV